MGKFLLGLVVGLVVGVLAMAYNPGLTEDVRAALVSVSSLVLRGTEEAAEQVKETADEAAKEAREGTSEQPAEAVGPKRGQAPTE
ncbi:MAG TPA: hypothetical protein VE592_07485 [Geminicoccaceae bacterium]|jgi:hypothetical protein|nr:hypothetical protein [Geminicoccaceae bacterium]